MSEDTISIGVCENTPFTIPVNFLLSGRTAVVGMSGSGKSHLLAVICEELCKAELPFVVIDPEGEYHSLKEKYEVVWAANEKTADIQINVENTKILAENLVKTRGRLILDIANVSNELPIISTFLATLYKIETQMRVPLVVLVEEADRFVPQTGGDQIKEVYEICKRGRKRGIGLIVATQRPAIVNKTILSQCGNQFIGRLRIPNDLEAVKDFFQFRKDLENLPNLEKGEFYVMGEISPVPRLLKVRARETKHFGATPQIKGPRGKFSVEQFLGENMSKGVAPSIQKLSQEEETVDAENKKVVKKGEKRRAEAPPKVSTPEEGYSIPPVATQRESHPVLALNFGISLEDSLKIIQKTIRKSILSGLPLESVELCVPVYWPLMISNLEIATRSFFGELKITTVKSLWDCVFPACIRYDRDTHNITEIVEFDEKISRLDWKEIRIVKELGLCDSTVNDIVQRTRLSHEDAKKTISKLVSKRIVFQTGKVGKTPLYRPVTRIKVPEIGKIETDVPEPVWIIPPDQIKILPSALTEKEVSHIVQGIFEETAVSTCIHFYFPFFVLNLRDKKTEELRVFRVNGINGRYAELGVRMRDIATKI